MISNVPPFESLRAFGRLDNPMTFASEGRLVRAPEPQDRQGAHLAKMTPAAAPRKRRGFPGFPVGV
ncbi:hypothetical protein ABI59_15765 [Acidobacteria bacterium Mor1]|nr:hypothetical protein ABI59_15765 [Acidobacteria bacterium Mor1]